MRCYEAIGSTYTADGWTPQGTLFSVLVPEDDNPLEVARSCATHGPGGCAMHGCEDVIEVRPVPRQGRRPRNARLEIDIPRHIDRRLLPKDWKPGDTLAWRA